MRFRHAIQIQSPVEVQDGFGGVTKQWVDFSEVYADIAVTSSQESSTGGGYAEITNATFTTRYFPGVTSDMRILYGTRVFQILGIRDVNERGILLEIAALEVTRG